MLQAPEVAKAAAGDRNIVNEISIQPVGAESESKDIASDLDGAIEKYYRAALIAGNAGRRQGCWIFEPITFQ